MLGNTLRATTVCALICIQLMESMAGSPEKPPIRRLGHEETLSRQRNQRKKEREIEMINVYWGQTAKYENDKNECKEDQFLSISGSAACESCDKFCLPSMNVAACPEKCRIYYLQIANKKQAGQISEMYQTIQDLQKTVQELKKSQNEKADVTTIWAAIGIEGFVIVLATLSMIIGFAGKIKAMQRVMKDLNKRFGTLLETHEKTKIQLEEMASQQKQKRFQQATPDTTPSSSNQSSPSSTLSRPTVTTVAEEVDGDNGDGIPNTNVDFVNERPGGK